MFAFRKNQANIEKSRGQSMVEFALALPVFLLILFGIFEFGMLIFSVAVVNGAAREGARYGAAQGVLNQYYDCSGIEGAVTGVGNLIGIQTGDVTIAYDKGDSTVGDALDSITCSILAANSGSNIGAGDRISVSVNYTYNPIMRNILGLPVPQLPLSSTVRRLILKDLVIQGAAGMAGVLADCSLIGIETIDSPEDFLDGTNTLDLDITNSTGEAIQIEGVTLSWPNISLDNGPLQTIKLSGATIWNTGEADSPAIITTWGGTSSDRQIANSGTSNIAFAFQNRVSDDEADSDYSVTVNFRTLDTNTTCSKTTIYDGDAGVATVDCTAISIESIESPEDFLTGSNTLDLNITNGSGEAIKIDLVTLTWPSDADDNGDLSSISLSGTPIWSSGSSSSPATLTSWSGTLADRQIASGGSGNIGFVFADGIEAAEHDSDYVVSIEFISEDSVTGCLKTASYDNGITVCSFITAGTISHDDGSFQTTAQILNGSGEAITIDSLSATWNDSASENGALLSISIDGNEIFNDPSTSILSVPSSTSWKTGTAAYLNISGASATLVYTYEKGALEAAFTGTTITFTNGCSVTFP